MKRRVALLLFVLASGCIQTFQGVKTTSLDPHQPTSVSTPVKAHLLDGSTVVFQAGIDADSQSIKGTGYRYDLALRDSMLITSIPLDSVVGMEVFEQTTNDPASLVMTLVATAGAGLAVAGLAIAIFGSCPTFYTDSAGTAELQAEGFSYSIAPIFEGRDVDGLSITQASDGTLRLEVRNEALETHYINQLELLEVPHATGERAYVDELNRIVVTGPATAFARATDMRGTDVARVVSTHDDASYRTDPRSMRHADLDALDDWITLSAPAPSGVDSVAIVLRLRNSLLNTTLLYDVMLGEAGARSLAWVGQDLKQVGPALAMAQWYQQRMGMNVAVSDGKAYRMIAHVRDTGPIAWKDVAVVVPVLGRDSLRVRLSFPKDNWRIDYIALAPRARRAAPTVVRLVDVRGRDARPDTGAISSLRDADSRYLQTTPGEHFTAIFRSAQILPVDQRSYFVASQGYYIEWMRANWLRTAHTDRPFVPSDAALVRAMARWRTTQDSLETLFAASKIPVR